MAPRELQEHPWKSLMQVACRLCSIDSIILVKNPVQIEALIMCKTKPVNPEPAGWYEYVEVSVVKYIGSTYSCLDQLEQSR